MITSVTKYFPDLTPSQINKFEQLFDLYSFWNSKINVISRKDIDLLYEHHVLHSLGIAKVISFKATTQILDVGTGGGFPGIPLAILFNDSNFTLADSIGKKIKVVTEIAKALGLTNLEAIHQRAEQINKKFDFVVSRAVTEFPEFYNWVKTKFLHTSFNNLPNGILYLKGGNLKDEFGAFYNKAHFYDLKNYFTEEFFETKKVVYYKM